jgi:hypothetical protein
MTLTPQFLALTSNPAIFIQRKAEIGSNGFALNPSLLNRNVALNLTGGYNPSDIPLKIGVLSNDHPVLSNASCYHYRSQIAFSQSSSHWLTRNEWWIYNYTRIRNFTMYNFTSYSSNFSSSILEEVTYFHLDQLWITLSSLEIWNYYRFERLGIISTEMPKAFLLPFLGNFRIPFIRYFYKKSAQNYRGEEKNEDIQFDEANLSSLQAVRKLLVFLQISWILDEIHSYVFYKKGEKSYLRQAVVCMFQQFLDFCSFMTGSCCILIFCGYFEFAIRLGYYILYLCLGVVISPFLILAIFGTIEVSLELVNVILLLLQFTLTAFDYVKVTFYYLWIFSYTRYMNHNKRNSTVQFSFSSSQRLQKISSSIMDSFGLYSEFSFSEATNIPIVAEEVSKTPPIFKSIFVRDETTHIFENIDPKMLLYDFTTLIRQKLKIDDDQSVLLNFNGKGLNLNIPLFEFGLQNESTIQLFHKLVGGMMKGDEEDENDGDYVPDKEPEETPEKARTKPKTSVVTQKGSKIVPKGSKDTTKQKNTSSQLAPKNNSKGKANKESIDVDLLDLAENSAEVNNTITEGGAQTKELSEKENQASVNPPVLNNTTTNPFSDDHQEKNKLLNSSGLLPIIMSSLGTLNQTPMFNPNQDLSKMTAEEIESMELAANLWILELAKLKKGKVLGQTQPQEQATQQQKAKMTNAADQITSKPDDGKKKSKTLPDQKKEQKKGGTAQSLPQEKEKSKKQDVPTKLVASDQKVYDTFIHDTPYKQPSLNKAINQQQSSKTKKFHPVATDSSSTTTSSSSSSYKSNTSGAKQQAKGSDDPSDSSTSSSSTSSSDDHSNSSNESYESEDSYEEFSGEKGHKDNDSEDDPPKKGSFSSNKENKKDKKKKLKTKASKHTHKKRDSSSSSSSSEKPCPSSAYENFDIDEALLQVLGTEADRKKFKGKLLKTDIKLKNVPIFTETTSFIQWWKLFRYAIQTTGLIGFVDQIEYLFHQCLEDSIQQFLCEMDLKTKPSLELMMRVVLSNYNKKPMSRWDYQEALNKITKKKSENVSAYYLRFTTLAKQAENRDTEHLRVLFMKGLKPLALWKEVNGKLSKNSVLKEAYEWAIHFEEKYTQLVKHQEEEEPKKEQEKENSKASAKPAKISPKNNNSKNPPQPKKSEGKKEKTPRPDCGYCGKIHDFRECKEKYPFYRAREVKLILSVGKTPVTRTGPPKEGREITKDTEWVKRLLEKKEKDNTSDQANAKIQGANAAPQKLTFYQRKNQRKEKSFNQQKDDSVDDSSKKL